MVAPNVPKHAVIAASYAALNPRDELWRLYIQELERRKARGDISDAEYHLLRSSREARELLVDSTFGDEHAFTAGTVDEVLAHAAGIIREEAEKDAAVLREEAEAASRRETHERTRRELVEAAHRERMDRDVAHVARIVGIAATVIVSMAILVALIASVPGSRILEIKGDAVRVVLWVCFGVGALLGLYAALVKHVSAKDVGQLVSSRIESVLRDRGHRRLEDIHAEAARSADDAAESPLDSAEGEG